MKTKELRSLLEHLGCDEVRQSGSHLIVRCGNCQTVIPVHTGDLRPGVLRSIERTLTPCLGEGWLKRG